MDQTTPGRVFAQYLEFAIDYTKPIAANNGSWTLVKNWRASLPASYFERPTFNNIYITNIFRDVLTMRNGRIYGFLRRFSDNKWVLAELPAKGPVRMTKLVFDAQNRYTYHITADGSLKQSINNYSGTTGTIDWQNRPLTGFDADNDPVWGQAVAYAAAPVQTGQEPVNWYGGHGRTGETTSSNIMISFDPNKVNGTMGTGYHLGGIRVNDNKWLWKTARTTSTGYKGVYPTDGAFDVGNGVEYAGGNVSVFERHIFWNYHGEFWKGSQTNKWQHVYDNGLLVGVFGKTGPEARLEATDGGPVVGMAGNVLYGTVVKAPDGNVYLYHGEESGWAGVNRWRIDGLNTIQEQTIPLQALATYPTGTEPSATEGLNLLGGLLPNSTLQNATAGWTRNPANEINNAYNDRWTAKTSVMSYDRFASPDLYVNFSKAASTYMVSRDLGTNNGLSAWSLKGVITFDGTNPNNGTPQESDSGGSYFEVLDNAGKVLVRLYNQVYFGQPNAPVFLYGNNQVIAQGQYFNPATATGTGTDPIEISMAANKVTIRYRDFAPVTASALDNGGNLQNPKTVRLFFWENGRNYERTIDIQSLNFSVTNGTTAPAPVVPGITSGGTYFVKAKHSGRNFDVFGASTADGALVKQWLYNGGKNQQWQLTDLRNGYYTVKSVNSNKFLSVVDASLAEGAVTSQLPANGQTNQQFKLVDAGEGYYRIIVANSQKCLTVQDAQTGSGPSIQQNTCGTGDHQKFLLTEVGAAGGRLQAIGSLTEGGGSSIRMYPNPATNIVTIEGAEGALVSVIDGLGRVRLTASCDTSLSTFSILSLPTGMYIVQIRQGLTVVSKKLVVNSLK